MTHRLSLTQDWPHPLRRLILEGCEALAQGQKDQACARFEEAIALEPNIPEAHQGLALAQRPGPDYLQWLARLQAAVQPRVYLEIGVESGTSLRLAQAPTCAIGIDPAPEPQAAEGAVAPTHIYAMTSQESVSYTHLTLPTILRV